MEFGSRSIDIRLALCREIAGLAQAKLPLLPALDALSRDIRHPLSQLAAHVSAALQQGQSLDRAIAPSNDWHSRQLAAVVRAGEQSGALDRALGAWIEMEIANLSASRRLRSNLLYPLLLIIIATGSLAITIWHLIPEYERSFLAFHQKIPDWFSILIAVRSGLWWESIVFTTLILLPFVFWFRYHATLNRDGWPNEPARRSHLQALCADISALLIDGQVTSAEINSFARAMSTIAEKNLAENSGAVCTRFSTGHVPEESGKDLAGQGQSSVLIKGQPSDPLSREIRSLYSILEANLAPPGEISRQLRELATFWRQEANLKAMRTASFFPMCVAVAVGIAVVITYVVIIYLPWLELLSKIVAPPIGQT